MGIVEPTMSVSFGLRRGVSTTRLRVGADRSMAGGCAPNASGAPDADADAGARLAGAFSGGTPLTVGGAIPTIVVFATDTGGDGGAGAAGGASGVEASGESGTSATSA